MLTLNNVSVKQGNSPLLLGFPHIGTFIPEDIKNHLNERGKTLSDTDWHIDKLYDELVENVTTVSANFHRYVIDPNRDPSGLSLYPGQNTTDLVPLTDFDGTEIWGTKPSSDQIQERVQKFHSTYHHAIELELARLKKIHGFAILYDCHSIRSVIPNLFEGILPTFNIGTNKGKSCHPNIEKKVHDICLKCNNFSSILNGRFTGGWTTRNYGNPAKGIHTIQMELAQSSYLVNENSNWKYSKDKADKIRPVLKEILTSLVFSKPL